MKPRRRDPCDPDDDDDDEKLTFALTRSFLDAIWTLLE
jgi:hypothetical protein